jgi:hypothetical protein
LASRAHFRSKRFFAWGKFRNQTAQKGLVARVSAGFAFRRARKKQKAKAPEWRSQRVLRAVLLLHW